MGRRTELGVWSIVVAMLGVVAFAAVAAPRLLREAEAESLEQAIERAPVGARQLVVRVLEDAPAGTLADPLEPARERLAGIGAEIPASVLDRFVGERFVADTARFAVSSHGAPGDEGAEREEPALPTFVTFRVHPELDEHSALVDGRRAVATDRTVDGLAVFEFELTPDGAAELGWELGETVELTVDPTDPVTRSFNQGLPGDFVAELVGLRELDPADDRYWFGDPRLHRPTVADTGIAATVFVFGIVHPDQLPTRPFLLDSTGRSPFALEQRRDLDPGAVTLDSVGELRDGLASLEASFASQPTLTRPGVVTGLRPVIETELGQRDAARSTLVLAAAGVLGVALTTLAQVLVGAAGRRRGWLTVARARGASRPHVVVAAMAEMAVLASVAVVLGGTAAWVATPGSGLGAEGPLVVATWLGAVVCAGMLAVSEGLRPVTVSGRPNPHPGLGRWARIADLVLVAAALGAVVTFRRRGVPDATVDPLVVLVPVLVPLAIVRLTRGSIPWVLGRVARRGLALGTGRLVGLRRVAASPDAAVGMVTVIVLALTVTALGVGVDRALAGGAVDASWTAVGAPYRIETRSVEVRDRVAELPGTVVAASGTTRVNLRLGGDTYSANLLTVDVEALAAITAGTVAAQDLPVELASTRPDGSIPVVASRRVNGRLVAVDDRLEGIGTRAGQVFHVVAIADEALGRDDDFLVADRGVLMRAGGTEPGFNTLAIDAPAAARADLERIAAADGERVLVRDDVLAEQLDDPLSRAVRRGYLLAAGFALTLALVALAAAAAVTARQRRREVAILGLLGAGRGEAAAAVVAELVPAVLTGTAVGSSVGWLVARSFDGRFDLSAFASGTPVSIRPALGALVLAAVAIAAASLVVIGVLVRRIVTADATDILRADGAA